MHFRTSRHISNVVNGYTTFLCRPNLKKKGSGGLAVLIKKHLRPGIKFEKIISTDFIFFKMCKNFFSMPEDVYICAVYLPPINSSYTQKDQNVSLFDILEDEISKYCCKAQVILLGDLNARVNVKDKDYIQHDEISHNQLPQCYIADNIYYSRNSQDRGPTNDQGKQLLNFCIGTRMRNAWRYQRQTDLSPLQWVIDSGLVFSEFRVFRFYFVFQS